jgi:conjugative transfer pilus assembly protein TraH
MKSRWLWPAMMVWTLFAGMAQADVEDAMREHLDTMVAATPPTTFDTSNQAGVYFGSFSQRYQMVNSPPIVNFTPPSIRSGCGGWDLHGGSFSFISSEQIMNFLRSIASAVPAVAFQMALSVLSDKLEIKISDWLKKMQEVNLGQLNTCRVTSSLLAIAKGDNDMGDVMRMMGDDLGLNELVELFTKPDATEAGNPSGGKTPGAQAAAVATEDKLAQMVAGNIVWRILKNGTADQWLSSASSDATLMQWMSVIGTEIGCFRRNANECELDQTRLGDDESGIASAPKHHSEPIGHTMTLTELVTSDPDNGKEVSVLTCLGGTDELECLRVRPVASSNFRGMRRILEDELLGPNRLVGEGLLGRHKQLLEPTNRDRRLKALGGPLLRKAMEYTDLDEQLGRRYVETFTQQIATEITINLLREVMAQARTTMSSNKKLTGKGVGLRLLQETDERIQKEAQVLMQANEVQMALATRLEGDYLTGLARTR